jgi:hypothetical protein
MERDEVSILFTGDYHIYGPFDDFIKKNRQHNVFSVDLVNLISKSSFSIFNLENPITSRRNGIVKFGPYGVGSNDSLVPIKKAGFNLATFATNHTYDMGNVGIEDTLNAARENNIEIIGAGLTEKDARRIYYKEIGKLKFAILNFARKEFNIVTENHGGANPLDIIDNINDIRKAKENADFVIVIVHEGQDVFHLPYPGLVKQLRFYAEMGANLIVTHHARYFSGYELYNNVPIFYGLGNLLHYSIISEEHNGLIIRLLINVKRNIKLELHPILFDPEKMQVDLAKDKDQNLMLTKIHEYSDVIINENLLKKQWTEYVLSKKGHYLSIASGRPHIIYRVFKKIGFENLYIKFLMINKKRFLGIWNIARCQAHFEAFNQILMDAFNKKNT